MAPMAEVMLPKRRLVPRRKKEARSCPAHRAWVRRHHCSVPRCEGFPIECAHVRGGTDGGQGLKPSDRWTLSLCREHHAEQHRIGEVAFEGMYGIDMRAIARAFAQRSPHRNVWHEG